MRVFNALSVAFVMFDIDAVWQLIADFERYSVFNRFINSF
jgi:hypothetical protein